MGGEVRGYETKRVRRAAKNVLLGVKLIPVLMWQRTDRRGDIHTEIGIEVQPGDIRKLPGDIWDKAQPVGAKLQRLLVEERHPELAVKESVTRPQAVTPGPGRPEPQPKFPGDFDQLEDTP
jgi:hypothetical protein